MEYLNESRVMLMKEKLKEAESEGQRLLIIKQLFKEMKLNSDSIINKMDSGVTIENFDEVRASLANEFNKHTKKLMSGLKDLQISNDEWMRIISALKREDSKSMDADVQTIHIKRDRNKVEVLNFDEFPIQDAVKITNLSELQKYFTDLAEKLSQSLKVDIKPPQVNVEAPQVNVPAPIVNIPDMGISELKDRLKEIYQSLKPIKNNRVSNPLSVRLSDGEEFIDRLSEIVDTQKQQIAAFPGQVKLHKNSEVSIKSPGSISNGAKDVTSAGTAVALVAASTPCRWVILCAKGANTGKIYYGGSTVSATSGAYLWPGASERIEISNLQDIYIDSDTNSEGVQFSYA